ncbi:MAG: hypothetical protein ABL921_34085, partial [Pirellula sp.]
MATPMGSITIPAVIDAAPVVPGLARWFDKWESKMLDTAAMQIAFTTPTELSKLWRMNKELFATVLFDSAKDSLLTLLADPQYLG